MASGGRKSAGACKGDWRFDGKQGDPPCPFMKHRFLYESRNAEMQWKS